MQYDLLILSLEFVLFYVLYLLVVNNKRVQNFIIKFKNFKFIILSIFVLQLISIAVIKFNVTDVFLFSDAGQNLLDGVDTYWIDAEHGKYPFFPFLIYMHAGLVTVWQKLPLLTFNFYLKTILLLFLHLLGFALYKEWEKKDIKKAKLNLLAYLLSPITYLVVLYHGQISIILITFLYFSIKAFTKNKSIKQLIIAATMFAISIATKTWSVIMLPIFAIPALKNFSIKEISKFSIFSVLVIGMLLVNIKLYTLSVFGSSTKVVLAALSHPGGPRGIWGISFIVNQINSSLIPVLSKLPLVGFTAFWSYIYYQIKFTKKKYSEFLLVLLAILTFYIFAPYWGVQYIFWHWPFLLLLTDMKYIKNWVYQLVIPVYLFINYIAVTTGEQMINPLLLGAIGLIIFLYWIKLTLNFLKNPEA